LKTKGILNEIVIIPNLLGDYLVEELGYEREHNFVEFACDWPQDKNKVCNSIVDIALAANAETGSGCFPPYWFSHTRHVHTRSNIL
jgi:hypothetical protein